MQIGMMDIWMDEEDLDLNEIFVPQDEENHVYPIYSMKEHFAPRWDNVEA